MVKKHFSLLKSHAFTQATFWMLLATMLMNIGSFFYVLVPAHLLTPDDYATMVAFISILGLIAVPASILQLIVISLVAEAKGRKDQSKIAAIYGLFLRYLFLVSTALFVGFLLFGSKINGFLHVTDSRLLIVVILTAIVSFFLVLVRSILQGIFAFRQYAISSFWEMLFKISFVFLFYFIGLAVFGALLSFLLTQILVLIYGLFTIREFLSARSKKINISSSEILRISLPAAFLLLGTTSFYTSDVILVKHFFPENLFPNQASLYAGISTLGKIIFFGNLGISSALLPLSTERFARNEKSRKIFYASFALICTISTTMTLAYFLLPKYLLLLLGQASYQEAQSILGLFAIFMSIHSLVYLFGNFFFSIRKVIVSYFVFAGGLFQIFGILLFHSNLKQVIFVSISVSCGLLLILLAYSLFHKRHSIRLSITTNLFGAVK